MRLTAVPRPAPTRPRVRSVGRRPSVQLRGGDHGARHGGEQLQVRRQGHGDRPQPAGQPGRGGGRRQLVRAAQDDQVGGVDGVVLDQGLGASNTSTPTPARRRPPARRASSGASPATRARSPSRLTPAPARRPRRRRPLRPGGPRRRRAVVRRRASEPPGRAGRDEHGGHAPVACRVQQLEQGPGALGDVVAARARPRPVAARPGVDDEHVGRDGREHREGVVGPQRLHVRAIAPAGGGRVGDDREHRPVPGRDEGGGRGEQSLREPVAGCVVRGRRTRGRAGGSGAGAAAGAVRPRRARPRRRATACRNSARALRGLRTAAASVRANRTEVAFSRRCRRRVTRASSASVSRRLRASEAASSTGGTSRSRLITS